MAELSFPSAGKVISADVTLEAGSHTLDETTLLGATIFHEASGDGTDVLTLPSSESLYDLKPVLQKNHTFHLRVVNTGSGACTVALGAGMTLKHGTLVVPPNHTDILTVKTTGTPASPSFSVVSLVISSGTDDQFTVGSTLEPFLDNTYDLGSASHRFRNVYAGGNLNVAGNSTVTGVLTLGAQLLASSDAITVAAGASANPTLATSITRVTTTGTGSIATGVMPSGGLDKQRKTIVAQSLTVPYRLTISALYDGTGDSSRNVYLYENGDSVDLLWSSAASKWLVLNNNTDGMRPFGKYVVNAHDYGARGDGSTDDTVALNAAAVAARAKSAVLYVPAGRYVLTNKVSILGSNRVVKGDGPNATRFLMNHNGDGLSLNENTGVAADANQYCLFTDFGFEMAPENATNNTWNVVTGIRVLDNNNGWTFADGNVVNDGLGTKFFYNRFRNLHFVDMDYCIRFSINSMLGPSSSWARQAPISSLEFHGIIIRLSGGVGNRATTYGIYYNGGSGPSNTFSDCIMQATTITVRIGDRSNADPTTRPIIGDLKFSNCHINSNTGGTALQLTDGTNNGSITGGNAYGRNVCLLGCQMDGPGKAFDWEYIRSSRAIGGSYANGVPASTFTNCSSLVLDRPTSLDNTTAGFSYGDPSSYIYAPATGAIRCIANSMVAYNCSSSGAITLAHGNSDILKQPVISLTPDSNAANGFAIASAPAGSHPSIGAIGSDSNINTIITAKGTGVVQFKCGSDVPLTVSGGGTNGVRIIADNALPTITALPTGNEGLALGHGSGDIYFNGTGNIGMNRGKDGAVAYGGGTGVIGIKDCGVAPTTNPTGGGVLFSDGGALKWRGSGGTVTTIAPA